MKIFRLRGFEEYKRHIEKNKPNYAKMKQYEETVSANTAREFTVPGFSYPANQTVDFHVDHLYSDGKNINWRERLICPVTGLNNRLRCSIHMFDFELSPYPGSKIYITEAVTPLYTYLESKFENVTGSEYLGENLSPGEMRNNIRHEDMTRLSFEDASMDFYLSFECFEHIPFYKKAITEVHRVLKEGGIFLGSFPFDRNRTDNLIKATVNEKGEIIYFMEPEYHGDPVNEKGILCYTIFGWEVLEQFHQAGFRDVYAILLWSDVFGYLGGEQVLFIAKK